MKVTVKVGEYFVTPWNFTWLYFQMVLSKRGPPYSCLLGGNKLNRTDMYYVFDVCICGLWEVGMYLGFGFNAHNSNFTEEFDVPLKFFLLVSDKRIWAKLCLSAVLSRPGLRPGRE